MLEVPPLVSLAIACTALTAAIISLAYVLRVTRRIRRTYEQKVNEAYGAGMNDGLDIAKKLQTRRPG